MKHLLFFGLLIPLAASGQSNYASLNEDYYHLIDRYEIRTGRILPSLFTAIKPYKRSHIVAFVDSARSSTALKSAADEFNYQYLMNDSWEWSASPYNDSAKPFLRHFYKKKSDFFHYHSDDFDLHVNPVLYVSGGFDSGRNDPLFINTRGAEVRGMIDRKLGFYTYLTDNQALLPSYVWDQMRENPVIPHEGFWKEFKDGKGVDFLQARGYITFDATKHIHLALGHDRFFLGNGYRSLVLSDYSAPSMFLRANVNVWKLNYLFLLNQMTADVNGSLGGLRSVQGGYPNKFAAIHHISMNIGRKLNIGLFESVIFTADDSTGSDHLRLDYFNPIIFYRAIEQQNGSSDNVLLGLDFKWNALKNIQLYGQFVLDEFVLDHIRAADGWWANKYAIQAGMKYIDALNVSNLDLQGEINIVRPYTYSHNTNYGSYTNYRQPLAHPLGANFTELAGLARYQPLARLQVSGKLLLINTGRDGAGENWGGDLLKKNTTRMREFGNETGQGIPNTIYYMSVAASWQIKHNLFADATVTLRKSQSDAAPLAKDTSISSLALRWNIGRRTYEF